MRKNKKRLAALGVGLAVMAASVMSLSASASSPILWPGFYTPYTGSFYATTTGVQVTDLYWSASQVSFFQSEMTTNPENPQTYGIEFEFRPLQDYTQRPNGTHDIWSGVGYFSSNLPYYYYEFQDDDYDDVAICTGDLKLVVAEKKYYGYLGLTKQPNFNVNNLPYTFESEYNYFSVIPYQGEHYFPQFYATYLGSTNNVNFGTPYSWPT